MPSLLMSPLPTLKPEKSPASMPLMVMSAAGGQLQGPRRKGAEEHVGLPRIDPAPGVAAACADDEVVDAVVVDVPSGHPTRLIPGVDPGNSVEGDVGGGDGIVEGVQHLNLSPRARLRRQPRCRWAARSRPASRLHRPRC